jgi:hypothetical protein
MLVPGDFFLGWGCFYGKKLFGEKRSHKLSFGHLTINRGIFWINAEITVCYRIVLLHRNKKRPLGLR